MVLSRCCGAMLSALSLSLSALSLRAAESAAKEAAASQPAGVAAAALRPALSSMKWKELVARASDEQCMRVIAPLSLNPAPKPSLTRDAKGTPVESDCFALYLAAASPLQVTCVCMWVGARMWAAALPSSARCFAMRPASIPRYGRV